MVEKSINLTLLVERNSGLNLVAFCQNSVHIMESVKKKDIAIFLRDSGITPCDSRFQQSVVDFLLEKFNLNLHEIEEESFQKFQKDVEIFQDKMKAFSKSTKKEKLLTKHSVRFLDIIMYLLILSFCKNSHISIYVVFAVRKCYQMFWRIAQNHFL